MTRIHIIAAAAICAVAACSDNPGPIAPESAVTSQPTLPTPGMATVTGRVIVSGAEHSRSVELETETGDRVLLIGRETVALASVDGADVVVRGSWDANPGLVVWDFEVLAMRGRPALDGILMLVAEGCALRLANGSIHLLTGAPESIVLYHGARIWVIGSDDTPPVEFGVIAAS